MFEFLASDAGYLVSWGLLLIGAADICIGWLWLGRKRNREEAEAVFPRFRRFLPWILVFDALLIFVGIYGLRMHGAF